MDLKAHPQRIVFLDYLRAFACLTVIIVHSSEFFYIGSEHPLTIAPGDNLWVSILDSMFRAAVPLFVMASSYLLVPLQYDTMPLTMVFLPQKSLFVTISIMENEVVGDLKGGRVRNVDTRYRTRFLLQMLLHISQLYLVYLRRIDRISSNTEARLHASVRNEELIQMLNLEKSLVYFSTSLKSDEVTLNKIAQGRIIPLYEDDQDLLEDVLVEIHQAIEMANIYSGTLSGTMDAFASIISNNLNIVMKVLSVITIVMAIPNIVFGFYGMNVGLPFEGVPLLDNWAFPLLLAAAGCLVAAWIFNRKGMWH